MHRKTYAPSDNMVAGSSNYGMTVAIRTELYKGGIFGYSWAYQTSGGYDYVIHRPLWTYYFQRRLFYGFITGG